MRHFSDIPVGYRIRTLGVALTFAIIAVSALGLTTLMKELHRDVERKTQQLVEAATSVLYEYEAQAKAGYYTEEDAKQHALTAISGMRYAGQEYFFVIERGPRMVMHPFKPELNGTDISDVKDPEGKRLFVDMVKVVEKDKAGFVPYMWPKPGAPSGSEPMSKISYVQEGPWGLIVGSGVYVDEVDAFVMNEVKSQGLVLAIMIGLASLLSTVIIRTITRPLTRLNSNMQSIAQGDLECQVSDTARRDEIGTMARALDGFRKQALQLRQTETEARLAEERAREQRKQGMLAMADTFERNVGQLVDDLAQVVTQLDQSAELLVSVAEQTKRKSEEVSQASHESSNATTTVAAATEELSSSIREISKQVQGSSQICNEAHGGASALRQHMNSLLEQAGQVAQVTGFINDVAEQINLLALNATIESARAGEAGRGFAVVAGEVKGLAGQTASASNNISVQMQSIHNASQVAHQGIERIAVTIQEVNSSVTSIAAAVEEQSAATSEISSSVGLSASSVNRVRDTIVDVQEGAEKTNKSALGIQESAQVLRTQMDALRKRVDEFLATVRNAS